MLNDIDLIVLCDSLGFGKGFLDHVTNLHKCDLRGRHVVDWTERHEEYIRRSAFRQDHFARDQMTFGPLGYHDPYMVWYRSITIRFLTCTGSFHELLVIFMSYTFIILYYIF